MTAASYTAAFKGLNGACAGVGAMIPALSFFTLYPPPLFEGASILTSAIAGAVILLTYYFEPRVVPPNTREETLVRYARNAIAIALVLIIVYLVMLKICTVTDPPVNPATRYQIGFWSWNWSLNEDGKFLVQNHAGATPHELMDYAVAFSKDGPAKVWKFWTILVAGISMIVVFLLTFVLWVFGWALLAKRKALDEDDQ